MFYMWTTIYKQLSVKIPMAALLNYTGSTFAVHKADLIGCVVLLSAGDGANIGFNYCQTNTVMGGMMLNTVGSKQN